MMQPRTTLIAALVVTLAACSDSAAPADQPTALLAVSPPGGAVGIDVGTEVTVTFSHGMAMGMEMYAALHEGDGVAGPIVDGAWTWSADRTRVTFTPAGDLEPAAAYTVHLGGGMTDSEGLTIDMDMHARDLNGMWVTETMMDERMMGGHGGVMDDMSGSGWQDQHDGYGMIFTFTTG